MNQMKRDITPQILELIRLTSTDLPFKVEQKLRGALEQEDPDSAAHSALETILANVEITRRNSTPICQDTGTPIFLVSHPADWDSAVLRAQIRTAVAEATSLTYLRPNAVDPLTGKNTGNNLGDEYFPTIHFSDAKDDRLVIDLMLKASYFVSVSYMCWAFRRRRMCIDADQVSYK